MQTRSWRLKTQLILNALERKPKNNQACRDSSPQLCDTGAEPALKPIELASKLGAGHWNWFVIYPGKMKMGWWIYDYIHIETVNEEINAKIFTANTVAKKKTCFLYRKCFPTTILLLNLYSPTFIDKCSHEELSWDKGQATSSLQYRLVVIWHLIPESSRMG